MKTCTLSALLALGLVTVPAVGQAEFIQSSPYTSAADSPFIRADSDHRVLLASSVVLEDFEDGLLNVPGVVANPAGQIVDNTVFPGAIDSVDGDGSGTTGFSYFLPSSQSQTFFLFDPMGPNGLPTHVGIVWTDGNDTFSFTAYGAGGQVLGSVSAPPGNADGMNNGGTAEDRFYGVVHEGGILKIRCAKTSSGLELDHLQYAWDRDSDGLSDQDEAGFGTNPLVQDSDGDGLLDGEEVGAAQDGCPSPANADSDGDTLSDGFEITSLMTDPCNVDTDGDGIPDNLDPFPLEPEDEDSDGDGLTDAEEAIHGTDPNVADTDGDGLLDGAEVGLGTNPLAADTDSDGLDDGDEVTRETDPLDPDSDGDGLSDGDEVDLAAFGECPNPKTADSDGDMLDDGFEFAAGLDFCDQDSDDDGLADGLESSFGTDPLLADTDGDGFFDGTEVDMAQGGGCPDPTNPDSDGDTLADGAEGQLGTDPCTADTDGDGVADNEDDLPTAPGVTTGFIEDELRAASNAVAALPLDFFDAPNPNARMGRSNAISSKLNAAANAIAAGEFQDALDVLESLLQRLDGASPPSDWMTEGPDKTALHDEIDLMMFLISLL